MIAASGDWGGKHALSFDAYHTIPPEWDVAGLLRNHESLGGTCALAASVPEEHRAGSSTWYRVAWYALADGIRAGDPACVELAVRFIEAHLIVSYAGFARQRLARALRHAQLTDGQRKRLSAHFLDLLEREERCHEFREYLELWSGIADDVVRDRAVAIASARTEDGFAQVIIRRLSRASMPAQAPGTAGSA